MSEDQFRSSTDNAKTQGSRSERVTYYDLLELTPAASVQDIRRAYREKSKLYHPDTTTLPTAIATEKFQQLNQAYATLSCPEQRLFYDRRLGFAPSLGASSTTSLSGQRRKNQSKYRSSAYLEPGERPLSPGELFALFILGLTFIGCLLLAIAVGLTRGELALQSNTLPEVRSIFSLPVPTPMPKSSQTSPSASPSPELPLPLSPVSKL
uniref:Heat shock protein DnaJ domain protein n=1 Tax=Cyanothece sp. (strain PCC 7425 / ATCC 29141) TaxID=395961 RepID=B8HLD8_CYAP4